MMTGLSARLHAEPHITVYLSGRWSIHWAANEETNEAKSVPPSNYKCSQNQLLRPLCGKGTGTFGEKKQYSGQNRKTLDKNVSDNA
jgi:hypothetical protein